MNQQVGLVANDPLRILGLQVILSEEAQANVVPLTIPGALHSFELSLLLIDVDSSPQLFEQLATFRRLRPDLRVIVLGRESDQEFVQRVIGAGAKGYLSHDAKESDIRLCIEVVRDGSIWAPRKVLARLIDASVTSAAAPRPSAESKFTEREGEVLNLLIEGRPNRDIAMLLGIDEGTVKAHISRLMRKVGVGNRTALTMHFLSSSSNRQAN
ncbi:response regulator transcription factor [Granulicella arctica]|uniref:DNA-binding NarL/FixJ family response regulator n=1 Tax=Granulicella arctica TaxID=940613 RepID=A0A7Y9PH77_9BACT|nr:DNA-binding NarL/FixJ family response regulator [Granulicella arctica]